MFLLSSVPKDLNNSSSSNRGCRLGDQYHLAGASWHPYLPPNGFDTCTVCTCNATTLDIKCPRVQCPSLACSEKEAFRPDKKACCKKCPEVIATSHFQTIPEYKLWDFFPQIKLSNADKKAFDTEFVGDQGSKVGTIESTEDILANGGCKVAQMNYKNGQEWHPTLPSHGEQKCIKCRCKVSLT